jgi:hypothetical protein
MSGGIEDFYVHTVTVETWLGTGAAGDVYQIPATVPGFLEGKNVLVRDATGQQVVASSTFYCSTADGAKFTPDSKVTTGGRVSHVIGQNVNDAPGLDLPDHAAIYLK